MEQIIKIAAQNNFYGLKGRSKFKNVLKNKNCGDEIKIEFDLEKKRLLILDTKVRLAFIVLPRHLYFQKI